MGYGNWDADVYGPGPGYPPATGAIPGLLAVTLENPGALGGISLPATASGPASEADAEADAGADAGVYGLLDAWKGMNWVDISTAPSPSR